jgi:cysteine desulfurase
MSGGGTDEPIEDREPIYLDHNATTPLDPRVLEAMVRVWRDCGANPASQHAAGRAARRLVEEAREGILSLLGGRTSGMSTDRLIFTSGGTEANNLALRNWGASHVAISSLEHPSIQAIVARLSLLPVSEFQNYQLERLPVLPNGKVDLTAIDLMARRASEEQRPALISVMLASNETGVLQPVREICQLVENRGMLVHTDAVQAVGKVPVNFRELGVHAMTVAPHKFHGPLGIGALVVRSRVQLQPQLVGGFQQESLRAGTESAALAVGFHQSLALAHEESTTRWARMRDLRDDFECVLRKNLPTIVIIGEDVPRLPHTSCISFPPLDRQALVMALDLAGVACSTGSACASGSSEPSPTLVAMGLPTAVVNSAIRFSLGAFTTAAEVHSAAERIIKTVNRLRPAR